MSGNLVFASRDSFSRLLGDLARCEGPSVVFDLAALNAIDSVGLGMIHVAFDDLSSKGRVLRVEKPRGMVRQLFELTEAHRHFEVRD